MTTALECDYCCVDIPLGRIEQPEDITGAAVFLASADSVTQQTLNVDGATGQVEQPYSNRRVKRSAARSCEIARRLPVAGFTFPPYELRVDSECSRNPWARRIGRRPIDHHCLPEVLIK